MTTGGKSQEMGATTNGTGSGEGAKGDVLTSIAAFFRDHPAIVGTILYFQTTSMGVIYLTRTRG